jgi:hypothetical protein
MTMKIKSVSGYGSWKMQHTRALARPQEALAVALAEARYRDWFDAQDQKVAA